MARRELPYSPDDPIFGLYYGRLQQIGKGRGGARDVEVEGALLVLSPRETEVIYAVMYDMSTVAEASVSLRLSESSVRTYLASALRKLEAALEPRLDHVVKRIEDAMSIALG